MINPSRSEDRRDRAGKRKLGEKAEALIVRERKAPARRDVVTLESCEKDIGASFERVAAAFALINGYRLAEANEVLKSLPAKVRPMGHSERVVRELAAIPKEQRVEVLKSVARDGPVTAKAVRERASAKVIDVDPEPPKQRIKHCPTCQCGG